MLICNNFAYIVVKNMYVLTEVGVTHVRVPAHMHVRTHSHTPTPTRAHIHARAHTHAHAITRTQNHWLDNLLVIT